MQERERYRWIFKMRGPLMAPLVIFFSIFWMGETENDWIAIPLGLALFLGGVLLRFWAQLHLHYRLRIAKVLTHTGPYVYVRNPIYIANTLILLGLCTLSELLWMLPVMLAWCMLVYTYVVRYEEQHLTNKYGDAYRAYQQQVARWLPRLPRIPAIERINTRAFIFPSLLAEVHCFLLLIPVILKEVVLRYVTGT